MANVAFPKTPIRTIFSARNISSMSRENGNIAKKWLTLLSFVPLPRHLSIAHIKEDLF